MRAHRVVLLVAGILGCGDSNGPGTVTAAFYLTTANGSAPPVLVAATVTCDTYLTAADMLLAQDGTFLLSAQTSVDCTAAGGGVSVQGLSVDGTYTLSGSRLSLQVPGAAAIPARLRGDSLTGTLPASPVTFPTPVDVVFLRRPEV